jgi:hypothetical protein
MSYAAKLTVSATLRASARTSNVSNRFIGFPRLFAVSSSLLATAMRTPITFAATQTAPGPGNMTMIANCYMALDRGDAADYSRARMRVIADT